ncbi:phage tail tape measure protein [Klebsiella quasipneumoniae]|uniref:phage tail tape measure protein n=1 Tax=Klebsiella quasipneumoniae TaxID=1463165 RepID=UPI00188830B1|nr:phage tail tape measure protein [Klebsiella quasipneumoniae]MBF2763503.1 phage tail tape measure protein [Klebsiella quasipneumoniae]QPP87767.1 phage tail tape measure protein [Klebsiella quasipneumoniae]
MADVASLAVGLHLNAASFKSQLLGAYGDAENQSRRFNRNAQADAKKTEEAYKKVGLSISGMASRLAGLAGAGLSIGTIVTTSRQYGQALSDLQAITGATAAEMKALDLAAQEMGRTTEYSASQAAEALKLMASAKPELLKTSDGLQKATNSALILAQAAGTTLPDATRTLALSLNQYGASAQEADRYINVLAAGAKYGSSEIVDTAAAIKNGGVAAAQAGVGFEQLNAAIQVLAEREIKGGEAGTALRNVILNLEKGTDKSLKPSVVGLSQALTTLSGKNLSTAQAVKLFGVENLNAASILVQNRSKLDELTASLTGTKTAHEQASIRVNNLNGDLLGLSSAFEGMVIKIGQSSNGPLRSGIQVATEALNSLADNFNTVSSVALYSLIPVLSTKLTAGLRENIAAWRESQAAVKARAQADADIARKTLDSTAAILKQNDAEFGHYRQMERTAKQYGMNISYQDEFTRLIRQETEQTNLASQAKLKLAAANRQLSISARAASVAVGLARGALNLIGGPFGAAMLAGSGLLYFHEKAKEARQSAIDLKDAVVETSEALMRLSLNQLNVKQFDLEDQYENQVVQRNQLMKEIQDADSRIDSLKGFDPFGQLEGVTKGQARARADLDSVNEGLRKTEENIKRVSDAKTLAQLGLSGKITSLTDDLKGALSTPPKETGEGNPWGGDGGTGTGKGSKSQVDQFKTLRQQIEEAHASSLARINLQEKDSNRELQEAAKKNGSDADLQRALLMNAENYQKQRLDLAAQYSPAQETLRKEQEASRDLAELFKARLLDEKEYQAARITLARDTAKELLQAHADEIAAPALDIAGEVDPLVSLRNQLAQRQALLQAYYQGSAISNEQYEMLMQKATKESADAQYQTSLELYRSQGEIQSLAVGLFETAHERSSNFLTSMLTRTRSFKENMADLFSSLTQSIIKNLVDMAAQALVTSSVMQTIMGVVGVGTSVVTGAAGAGSGTAIQNAASNFQFNAKGGVYDSPSLSAYSNQVYDSPQFFAFAKGAGVFGEAGPEAIMPLTRAGDGSLGVRAVGGVQNAGASEGPKVYITIEGGNTSTQAPSGFEQFGQQIGSFVEKKYRELMAQDMRPGGMVWNAVKGQR